ncbi:MAG: helix-turn-helix transcriptional regulator [Planctomycetes bacterium]|nr:helix-turn-helix transcriptional regulator [Planctomycetota bacterium]
MTPEELIRVFADNLRRFMDANGLTESQLRKKAGLKSDTVKKWLRADLATLPKIDSLVSVASALGCSVSELFARHATDVMDFDTVVARVLAARPDAVVLVSDPRLIRDQHRDLEQRLLALLAQSSLTAFYCYPSSSLDPMRDASRGRHSDQLREDLESRLPRLRGRVMSLLFDPVVAGSATANSGMLIFALCSDRVTLHQEVRGDRWSWVKIDQGQADQIWKTLRSAILPVPNPNWRRQRLHRELLHAVQAVIEDPRNGRKLAELAGPGLEDEVFVKDALQPRPPRTLEVLEVGSGIGHKSRQFFARCLPKNHRLTRVGRGVDYERGIGAAREDLETWDAGAQRFHVVCALHCMYTADPELIGKMLAVLDREFGKLLILHGNYKNNVLSYICGAVDRFLCASQDSPVFPYPGKRIKEDPLRLYTEDILGWLKDHCIEFRKPTVTRHPVDVTCLVDLQAKDWTETGQSIINFFLGNSELWSDWKKSQESRDAIQWVIAARGRAFDVQTAIVVENQRVSVPKLIERGAKRRERQQSVAPGDPPNSERGAESGVRD